MDSIAAPINDIQFPTVTVCHNGQRQPDRWAYLETILNFVKFSQDCFFDKYNDIAEEYAKTVLDEKCDKKLSKVRSDFKFLLTKIANQMKGWTMFKSNTKDQPILNDFFPHYEDGYINQAVADLLSKRKINRGLFFQLPAKYTATEAEISDILSYHLNVSRQVFFDSKCQDEQCWKNIDFANKALQWLHNVANTDPNQPFGSFLASFLSEMEYTGFRNDKYLEKMPQNICNKITANEKFLHNFFQRLSKSLGLNGTRTLSLLDLPMMFGNLHETTLNNGPFLKTSQFSFYSMCQVNPKFNPPEEKNCFGKWLHFIEKGMLYIKLSINLYNCLTHFTFQLDMFNIHVIEMILIRHVATIGQRRLDMTSNL